jgi:hypothetical protein
MRAAATLPVGEARELPEQEALRAMYEVFGVVDDPDTEIMAEGLELAPTRDERIAELRQVVARADGELQQLDTAQTWGRWTQAELARKCMSSRAARAEARALLADMGEQVVAEPEFLGVDAEGFASYRLGFAL